MKRIFFQNRLQAPQHRRSPATTSAERRAIERFIAARGVTYCPTVAVAPTQGIESDLAARDAHCDPVDSGGVRRPGDISHGARAAPPPRMSDNDRNAVLTAAVRRYWARVSAGEVVRSSRPRKGKWG